jgi:hypothetical protein
LVERTSVAEWCREFTNTERSATTLSSVAPVLPLPVEYPAQADVDALWSTSTAIADGCDAARYLYFRGVQPRLVRERDTARQLANGGAPEWAGSWSSSQHRLVIPMFDASGQMRSVLARSIERAPKLKSLAPRGFGRAGLVMACPAALEILRTGTRPSGFRNGWLIVIAEGEVDFLSAIQTSGSSHVAHFGIVSGSWTAAHAARIPDAATILLATDQDEAGERYAHAIASTFRGRNLTVKRWRPRAASEVQS